MPFKDPEERRTYNAQYHREWHRRNRARRCALARARKRELRAWWDSYRASMSCARCGESHIACLDFHHRNGESKAFRISLAISEGLNKDRIVSEIAKCEVLCANCHRKLHWMIKRERVRVPSP